MSAKGFFHWFFIAALAGTFTLLAMWTVPVHAQTPIPQAEPKCFSCHENLYFLHDTGKWFCLRDAPMSCVDCHGGDPTATTLEKAHANRAAYPIVNENITKCQECHPEKGVERVQIFREVAGLSQVRVAAAYVPVLTTKSSMAPAPDQEQPATILLWQEGFALGILVALVLLAVFITKSRHG